MFHKSCRNHRNRIHRTGFLIQVNDGIVGGLAAIAHMSLPVKLPGLEVSTSKPFLWIPCIWLQPCRASAHHSLTHVPGISFTGEGLIEKYTDPCSLFLMCVLTPDHISEGFLSKGESKGWVSFISLQLLLRRDSTIHKGGKWDSTIQRWREGQYNR